MNVTDWAGAITNLLRAAGISQAKLSARAGLVPMTWNRYVRGARKPDEQTVRSVNRAVAELLEVPEARDYLDALALIDELLRPDDIDRARAVESVRTILRSTEDYFVTPGAAVVAVVEQIDAGRLDDESAFVLIVALAAKQGKHLLGKLEGRRQRNLFIDEIKWAFDNAGIDLGPYLRDDLEAYERRTRERFECGCENALTALPVADRQKVMKAILRAYDEATKAWMDYAIESAHYIPAEPDDADRKRPRTITTPKSKEKRT